RNGVTLDVSGTNLRHNNGRTIYDHVNLTGYQSLHRRRGATVGHELNDCSGLLLEEHAGNMVRTTGANRSLRCLVGVRLQPRNQTFQVICRHALFRDDEPELLAISEIGWKSFNTSYCSV